MTTAPDPDKDKVVFEQLFTQYRTLNEQLNRIPPFAVTLTGGFWYIAVVIKSYGALGPGYESLARFCLMMFACMCNVMLVLIAIRVRDVMRAYETPLSAYAASEWPKTGRGRVPFLGDYSMIGMYCTLILGGALLSFVAAWVLYWSATGQPVRNGVIGCLAAVVALFLGYVYLPRLGRK
ncbi:hypothetical protein ASF31_02270 [Brevundimonas sp. Leaf280]|uniref:hypothetical protein n=1 Tax=Brevundimonas sp. Leaf280 TaxID=1736320 RepID=UPI0006FDD15B|nr:hypothetical protein [Brevundimonas sp. Leaf280]KQP48184.1 hypothetical protein ASF31_02270 [Brevundimonas sp. Leaf280]